MTSLSDIVLKIGDSIKFRHLGIGFVWAWIYCSFETSALYPDRSGVGINADISWLASAASVALCLFAFGFFFRFRDLSNRKNLPFIAAALMACGTFASAMAGDSAAVGVLSGIATGVGSALLIVLWGDALFASMPNGPKWPFPPRRASCWLARSCFLILRESLLLSGFRPCRSFLRCAWF